MSIEVKDLTKRFDGFTALVAMAPEERLGVVILTNMRTLLLAAPSAVLEHLLPAAALDHCAQDPSAPLAATAAAFCSRLLYSPVPTISREVKVRPATVNATSRKATRCP